MPTKKVRRESKPPKRLYSTHDAGGQPVISGAERLRDAKKCQIAGDTIARYVLVSESKPSK